MIRDFFITNNRYYNQIYELHMRTLKGSGPPDLWITSSRTPPDTDKLLY